MRQTAMRKNTTFATADVLIETGLSSKKGRKGD